MDGMQNVAVVTRSKRNSDHCNHFPLELSQLGSAALLK